MKCLTNFIVPRSGCEGVARTKPVSGLYVEDLSGITMAALVGTDAGKYIDAQTYIDEKMRFAAELLMERVKLHLEKWMQDRGILEAGTLGRWANPSVSLAPVLLDRGLRIEATGGPMATLNVTRVWIASKVSVDNLQVVLTDGSKTETYTIDVQAEVPYELWLNYEAETRRVDVTITDDRFEPMSGTVVPMWTYSDCDTCPKGGLYKHLRGRGLYDGTETDVLQGVVGEAMVDCRLSAIGCLLMRRMRLPLLYQWGILVLEEWLASSRANYFTIHSKEWAAWQVEQWKTVDMPRLMKSSLEPLAAFIRGVDPGCFTCGSGAKYANTHP